RSGFCLDQHRVASTRSRAGRSWRGPRSPPAQRRPRPRGGGRALDPPDRRVEIRKMSASLAAKWAKVRRREKGKPARGGGVMGTETWWVMAVITALLVVACNTGATTTPAPGTPAAGTPAAGTSAPATEEPQESEAPEPTTAPEPAVPAAPTGYAELDQ